MTARDALAPGVAPAQIPRPVPVLVLSDFTCPFSYVTEAALWRMEDEGLVALEHRAFELWPEPSELPTETGGAWEDAVRPIARELGLELRPPLPARTRKAHEAARLAHEGGRGREMRAALYAAAFSGLDLARIDVLVDLGERAGMERIPLRMALDVDVRTPDVVAEQEEARRAGIDATPALFVGSGAQGRLLLGARPPAELRAEILEAAASVGPPAPAEPS